MTKDKTKADDPGVVGILVARLLLLSLATAMTYVAIQPAYNFAHWLPHRFLYDLGAPYAAVLFFEQNADIAIHFMGALILTALLVWAKIPLLSAPSIRAFISISLLCLAAEVYQLFIDRGLESSDLLLGILGSFVAYLALNNKH